MFRAVLAFVTLFTVFLTASSSHAAVKYSKVDRATVKILAVGGVEMTEVRTEQRRKVRLAFANSGHGSGVKLTRDGIIVTAAHVVEGARLLVVKEPETDKAYPARVLYSSKKHDIAFLLIPGDHDDVLPLPENPPELSVRQTVFAVGYPLDARNKHPQSNRGVVAGTLETGDLQLGISVNPGNSGGPVIDDHDNLVGIVVRGADPEKGAQGLAHAVSLELIAKKFRTRVLGTKRLMRESKRLEKTGPSDYAAAALVARIAEESTLRSAIAKIEERDSGDFREKAKLAYAGNKDDADFLAVLAAHYWNESVVRYVLEGGSWQASRRQAKGLAKRALSLDDELAHRSPFLLEALGRSARQVQAPKHTFGKQHPDGVPVKASPQYAAGFRLGSKVNQARRACEMEEYEFEKTSTGFHCSGPAKELSIEVEVDLRYCGDKLCRVDLIHEPSKRLSALWKERFAKLKRHYEARYGRARRLRYVMPAKCESDLVGCLRKGHAVAIYSWRWKDRELRLSMGRLDGEPAIRISHRPRAK